MPIRTWQSHPQLHENAGRVALSRGPLLYCVEGVDHPVTGIDNLALDPSTPLSATFEPQTLGGVVVLHGVARYLSIDTDWDGALYLPVDPVRPDAADAGIATAFKAVPYFTWQNRGASPMAVWLRQLPRA